MIGKSANDVTNDKSTVLDFSQSVIDLKKIEAPLSNRIDYRNVSITNTTNMTHNIRLPFGGTRLFYHL